MNARKAIERIQGIMNLQYNGYGENIHRAEQLDMILAVLKKVKQEDWK